MLSKILVGGTYIPALDFVSSIYLSLAETREFECVHNFSPHHYEGRCVVLLSVDLDGLEWINRAQAKLVDRMLQLGRREPIKIVMLQGCGCH
jgi:hypothetical protein